MIKKNLDEQQLKAIGIVSKAGCCGGTYAIAILRCLLQHGYSLNFSCIL